MKPTNGGVKKSSAETYKNGPKNRRARAKERLEAQLKSRVKPEKSPRHDTNIPLTEQDVKRIEKEIEILKSR